MEKAVRRLIRSGWGGFAADSERTGACEDLCDQRFLATVPMFLRPSGFGIPDRGDGQRRQ